MSSQPTAVVFAYHNVGVRSIKTLLARGILYRPGRDARRQPNRNDLV
jgi:hypothetical protein